MPQPLTPESDLPTADVAAGGGRDLDDLERRLAAFDSATKRLSKTIDTVETKAGESSRPSSGNRRAVVGTPVANDDISALRPAISAASATTGALTARRRSEGGQVTPGFTSAHGKPAIAVMPAAVVVATPGGTAVTTSIVPRDPRRRLLVAGAGAGLLLVGLFLLARAFREIPDAYVWASSGTLNAPSAGTVSAVVVRVGTSVTAGAPLLRITSAADQPAVTVTAPTDSLVSRLFVATGTRIANREALCELADPNSLRVVVPFTATGLVATGDRVRIRLLGEDRLIFGTVESVHLRGDPTIVEPPPQQPAHALVLVDPGPARPALGQGARILPLGDDGTGRRILLWLRELLP